MVYFLFLLLSIFPIHLYLTDNKNRLYLKYTLFILPVLFLDMIPKGFYLSYFDVLSYVYFFFFIAYNKAGKESILGILGYALIVVLVIGMLFSEFVWVSFQHFLRFLPLLFFMRVLLTELKNDRDFDLEVINWLKGMLIFSLVVLCAQLVLGPGINTKIGFISPAGAENPNVENIAGIRYPSFFQDPQKYAQFLAAVSFLFFIDTRLDKGRRNLQILFFFLSVVALFLTGGRAAFLGLLVGLALLFFFMPPNFKFYVLLLAVIMVPTIFIFKDSFILFNRGNTVNEMYDSRYQFWKEAIEIYFTKPFMGIGIGNYQSHVGKYYIDQYWLFNGEITYYDQPESGYLKYLVEFGLWGFLLFMAFFLIPFFKGLVSIFTNSKQNLDIALMVASLISWFIGFITVCSFTDIRISIVISTITCILYLRTTRKNDTLTYESRFAQSYI